MHDPKEVLKICGKVSGEWRVNAYGVIVDGDDHPVMSFWDNVNFAIFARTALPEFAQRVIELEENCQRNANLLAVAEAAIILQKHLDLYDHRIYARDRDYLRKSLAAAGYGGEG